jgi:hypothetical protein
MFSLTDTLRRKGEKEHIPAQAEDGTEVICTVTDVDHTIERGRVALQERVELLACSLFSLSTAFPHLLVPYLCTYSDCIRPYTHAAVRSDPHASGG